MQNVYACCIEDGSVSSGKEFLTICAREFGAYIETKSVPLTVTVLQSHGLDTFHAKMAERFRKELVEYESMDLSEMQASLDKRQMDSKEEAKRQIERQKALNAAYQKILDEVSAWKTPSSEHEKVKTFAAGQLKECIDTDFSLWQRDIDKPRSDAAEYIASQISVLKKDIAFHEKQRAEETERARRRTEWANALNESLANMATQFPPSQGIMMP